MNQENLIVEEKELKIVNDNSKYDDLYGFEVIKHQFTRNGKKKYVILISDDMKTWNPVVTGATKEAVMMNFLSKCNEECYFNFNSEVHTIKLIKLEVRKKSRRRRNES